MGDRRGDDKRLLVIGLDCAAPKFLFGEHRFDLPHLRELMERGCYGPLRSCDPPITVPAWSCMFSGKDPGELGCYGFRNRSDYGYDSQRVSTSVDIREPRVWDLLSDAGKEVCVVGVPQTFPVKPVNGNLTAGLLCPGLDMPWTHPEDLSTELLEEVGDYVFDVGDFRSADKTILKEKLFAWLGNRFDVAEYMIREKPWDFFVMVEMGLDRLHHAFWSDGDPDHFGYDAQGVYRDVLEAYYVEMDRRIGCLLKQIDDDFGVMVVSDHGAKPMLGGVAINSWLAEQGYLVLNEPLTESVPFDAALVDWSRTRAWGDGGYYGRIFFNIAGREPEGVLRPEDVSSLKQEMVDRLGAMKRPDGSRMENRCIDPEEHYASVAGRAPELMVYWDDLDRRSVGLLGSPEVFLAYNDTGRDTANHDFDGIYVYSECGDGGPRSIYDVTPTILDWFGLPGGAKLRGNSWIREKETSITCE